MIYLNEKLAVTANRYSYNVGEVCQRAGGDTLVNVKYYGTMAQAIKGAVTTMLRQGISDGTIDTLYKFLKEAKRLQDDFSKKLEPLEC